LLSFAASTCYIYLAVISLGVWGIAKYYGCKINILETVVLYGYSFTIWIPISVNVFPFSCSIDRCNFLLRSLVSFPWRLRNGAVYLELSLLAVRLRYFSFPYVNSLNLALFLVRNFMPVISTAQSHIAKVLLILMISCQFALAMVFKFCFFNYKIISNPTPNVGSISSNSSDIGGK
jgi:hypothetical protein